MNSSLQSHFSSSVSAVARAGRPYILCAVFLLQLNPLYARLQLMEEAIHPRVITSKSGEYTLKLDPSDLNGRFEATYTLVQNNKSLWTKEFPFTLREVAVTNTGSILGYGYTYGLVGFGSEPQSGNGEFVIAIITRDRKTILFDKHERTGSRWIHGIPDPKASGMVVDEENDRLIVRVNNPDPNVRDEVWWPFRISNGGTFPETGPQLRTSSALDPRLIHVRAVNRSNLLLVQWWLYRYPNKSVGTMFSLHDENGLEVWSLSLPNDYTGENEAEQTAVRKQVFAQGALLDNLEANCFSLRFYADKVRVNFEASQNTNGNWNVKERSRQPFDTEISEIQTTVEPPSPKRATKSNASYESIMLKPAKVQQKHPIRNLHSGFDFDVEGNIGFIQHESGTPSTFLLVDTLGKIVATIPLDVAQPKDSGWGGIAFVGGNAFVATLTNADGKASAWRIATKDQSLTRLLRFSSPAVKCIAGCSDGGFVVLACEHSENTMTDSVSRHDANGLKLWTIEESFENYPRTLFSPESMCVGDTDEVLVLDNIQKQIQVFNPNGSFDRFIDLEKSWGREPNYPSGIASAPGHEILVFDFQGVPSMTMMEPSGLPKYSFDARLAKDRPALSNVEPKVDGEGRVWLTDGDTILRLGHDGVVDRILGEVVDNDTLGEIGAIAIDRNGNIAAQSRKTKVVHLFDHDGNFKHTFKDASLRDASNPSDPVSISPNGDVFVNTKNGFQTSELIRFASDGRKLETLQLDFRHVRPLGNTGHFLADELRSLSIIERGGELVRKIDRQPDGNWLEQIDGVGIANNGDFAVGTTHLHSVPSLPSSINLFSAKGDPIRTLSIPDIRRYQRMDYDCESIVLCGQDDICIYNNQGVETVRLDYPGKKLDGFWYPTLTQKGTELVLVNGGASHSLFRIPVPKR